MNKRTTSDEALALLTTLAHLAQLGRAVDLGVLAGRLGWGAGRVVRVLTHLEKKGLADRGRCRLTLAGLAIATAFQQARGALATAA